MVNNAKKVQYRILEIWNEGYWVGFGVAYEKDSRVLFFVPACRGVRELCANSIVHLDEGHFPSRESRYRWCKVQEWEDDVSFYPIAALKKHASKLPDGEEQDMQREIASGSQIERQEPSLELSPLRRLLKHPAVAIAAAAVCAVSLMGAALIIFWKLANPPVQPVPPGQEVFTRDVYIMIDFTESMMPEDIKKAREIITNKVFPSLGPGDRVFCYSIGADFVERLNRVFRDGSLPGAPENLLDARLAKRVPAEKIAEPWQQVKEVIEQKWTKQLDDAIALARPDVENKGTSKGKANKEVYWKLSNYLEAFSYIATRIKAQDSQHIPKQLIVLGDLCQDPAPDQFNPPAPKEVEKDAFKEINVRLIYPYRSTNETTIERPKKIIQLRPHDVERFWQQYFEQRGNNRVTITAFDDPTPPLPPNRVPSAVVKQ